MFVQHGVSVQMDAWQVEIRVWKMGDPLGAHPAPQC